MAIAVAPRKAGAHNTVREGIVAGALGAIGVAVWFLIVDLIATELFFTPTRLGMAVGRVFGITPMAESPIVAVVAYTVLHFIGFAIVGIIATSIVHASRTQPSLLAGAFLAFVAAQALFYGFIALLHATELLEHLTWVLIAIGNVIGAVLVGWKLWRDHPGLGKGFDTALGGY
jgi:hypothetical protein